MTNTKLTRSVGGWAMNHDERFQRQHEVLTRLSNLPRMILMLKERDNSPEFVLHDLCHPTCFNLHKAAYLVDNPDFDCVHGIAGFSRDEATIDTDDIWENQDEFSNVMQASRFNNNVRQIERASLKRSNGSEQEVVQELAQLLDISQPTACTWNMKHDNYGMLIFERAAFDDSELDEYLVNGVSLLSFCPIY